MKILATALLASSLLPGGAQAQTGAQHDMGSMVMEVTSKTDAICSVNMVDAEVRKIDKDTKKITLKHGDIKNLGMPNMTMVFRVKDPAMLDKVQVGDKVRFKAEMPGGALLITELQLSK